MDAAGEYAVRMEAFLAKCGSELAALTNTQLKRLGPVAKLQLVPDPTSGLLTTAEPGPPLTMW